MELKYFFTFISHSSLPHIQSHVVYNISHLFSCVHLLELTGFIPKFTKNVFFQPLRRFENQGTYIQLSLSFLFGPSESLMYVPFHNKTLQQTTIDISGCKASPSSSFFVLSLLCPGYQIPAHCHVGSSSDSCLSESEFEFILNSYSQSVSFTYFVFLS